VQHYILQRTSLDNSVALLLRSMHAVEVCLILLQKGKNVFALELYRGLHIPSAPPPFRHFTTQISGTKCRCQRQAKYPARITIAPGPPRIPVLKVTNSRHSLEKIPKIPV